MTPRAIFSFILVSLIWGGTWIVIRDQLSVAPPTWSVTYRFILACAAMFALAKWRKSSLLLDMRGQIWALALACTQFVGNFNFVYRSELYLTSGIVAVLFTLLIIPNAIMGYFLLGQKITRGFVLGSALAFVGVACLFVQEYRTAEINPALVWLGLAFVLGAIMSASSANILQGMEGAKRAPILTLLAWAMLWGVCINAAIAFTTEGAPVLPDNGGYWAGIAYLGLAGSVITFPLYYSLIREIGAGKAAYTSVIIPIVAMALSTIFEGYIWSYLAMAGAVLVLAGMLIAIGARRKKNKIVPTRP